MPEKIISVKASEQFQKDMKEYAIYVERHRITPEFRDGLKLVQRRIVYAAYTISHATEKRKSANVIGDTMGRFHPHGDESIKGALYTLVNWYQTKIPLFNGQGNFGNTCQNIPAADRYTEVKLSKFTLECILDELIQCKEIVNWEPNYDNSTIEPSYLPAKLPLLLINGSTGIAVGDKVDIPSHNINEVIDATIALIQNPDMEVVLVPDHCQSCEIVDTDWYEICKKGYGNYKVRGVVDIEPYSGVNKRYKGLDTLVIKSCPNLTFLQTVIDKIEDMVKKNKIIGIADVEEQSGNNDMRYVIVLKPGTDPNFMRNELYKDTALMQTARVNFKVLDVEDRVEPTKRLSYKGYLSAWIEFRKISKLRFFENKLQRVLTRVHVLNNYIWAIESGESDKIIDIIKSTKTIDDNVLIEKLIKTCKITDIQAKFFINCEIKKLSKAYLQKYKDEKNRLDEEANYYRDSILVNGKIEQIIIDELLEIKNKYGTPRRCRIISESEVTGIPTGEFKIVITENNFIKKIGVNDNILKPKNDNIKFVTIGDNSKSILLFDITGKVYNIPISKIPFSDKNSNGIDIRLINKYINAEIASFVYEPYIERFSNGGYMITVTKNGYIKRMNVSDFINVPPSGLVYCKLYSTDNRDSVNSLIMFKGSNNIVVFSQNKALIINSEDIPILKRNTRGCASMTTSTEKEIIIDGMSVLSNGEINEAIIITKNGYFNKIPINAITVGRAKRGSKVIKLTKDDNIVSIIGVNENCIVDCITSPNGETISIAVSDIPGGTTISTGQRMITGKQIVNANTHM